MSFSYEAAPTDPLRKVVKNIRLMIGDTQSGTQGTHYIFSDEDLIAFYGLSADVTPVDVVLTANALINATSLTVSELDGALSSGERLHFWLTDATQRSATLSGSADEGDASVSVEALAGALTSGAKAIATPGNTRTRGNRLKIAAALAL